jgi:hypothetical protein
MHAAQTGFPRNMRLPRRSPQIEHMPMSALSVVASSE